MPEKVCAQQKGHNSSINDVKIGSKNLMYTCSEDENVRVWNLLNLAEPLASKNPKCVFLYLFREIFSA
jgi:WD40 repeat protein